MRAGRELGAWLGLVAAVLVVVMVVLTVSACSDDAQDHQGGGGSGGGSGGAAGSEHGGGSGSGAGGSDATPPRAGAGAGGSIALAGQGGGGGSRPEPPPVTIDLDPLAGNDDFAPPDCGAALNAAVDLCGTSAQPCRVLVDTVLPLLASERPALALEPDRVHAFGNMYAVREGGTWSTPEMLSADFTSSVFHPAVDGEGSLVAVAYGGGVDPDRLLRHGVGAWERVAELPAGFHPFPRRALAASERCLHFALELDARMDLDRGGPAYAVWDGALQVFAVGPRVTSISTGVSTTMMTVGPDGYAQLAYVRTPGFTLYWARPGMQLEVVRANTPQPQEQLMPLPTPLAAVASDDDPDGFVVHVAWVLGANNQTLSGPTSLGREVRLSTRSDGAWSDQTVMQFSNVRPGADNCPSLTSNPAALGLGCELTNELVEPVAVFGSADGSPRVLLQRRTQQQAWGVTCPPPQLDCFNGPCPAPLPCSWTLAPGNMTEVSELLMAAPDGSRWSLQTLVTLDAPAAATHVMTAELGPDGHVHVLTAASDSLRHLELGL